MARTQTKTPDNQIGRCSQIKKITEKNPDLPQKFIQDLLIGLEEIKTGKVEAYKFS